jgi:hypothetical protein
MIVHGCVLDSEEVKLYLISEDQATLFSVILECTMWKKNVNEKVYTCNTLEIEDFSHVLCKSLQQAWPLLNIIFNR